jgi:hypothetical protein
LLGFAIAEEDPEHGGVFMTLGDNFHALDIGQHPAPETAQHPERGQIGLGHIAFQVGSYAALRDAYAHLVGSGVEILHATNHINQRSFYFADPDGNTLEIYYELPHAAAVPRRASRPGRGAEGQRTRRPVARLAARGLAAVRDEGASRGPARRLGLGYYRERDNTRCWSTLHGPPPATKI